MKKNLLFAMGLSAVLSLTSCDQANKIISSITTSDNDSETEQAAQEKEEPGKIVESPASRQMGAQDAATYERGAEPRLLNAHPVYTQELKQITLHPQASNSYNASNLFDNNNITAWVVGAKEYNQFESSTGGYYPPQVKIEFDGNVVDYALISNGYGKSSTSYYNNARPRSLTVYACSPNGNKVGTLYEGYLEDNMRPQKLVFNKINEPYSSVSFVFDKYDVYPGKRFQDICINELKLFGN